MTSIPPRVLDASALVELFGGNPQLLQLLELAAIDDLRLVVPTLAIAEAQAVLDTTAGAWDYILAYPGVTDLPVSAHAAVDIGNLARPRLTHYPIHAALIGPLMVAQVLHEATTMGAVIVTRFPEAYGGHQVTVNQI